MTQAENGYQVQDDLKESIQITYANQEQQEQQLPQLAITFPKDYKNILISKWTMSASFRSLIQHKSNSHKKPSQETTFNKLMKTSQISIRKNNISHIQITEKPSITHIKKTRH